MREDGEDYTITRTNLAVFSLYYNKGKVIVFIRPLAHVRLWKGAEKYAALQRILCSVYERKT